LLSKPLFTSFLLLFWVCSVYLNYARNLWVLTPLAKQARLLILNFDSISPKSYCWTKFSNFILIKANLSIHFWLLFQNRLHCIEWRVNRIYSDNNIILLCQTKIFICIQLASAKLWPYHVLTILISCIAKSQQGVANHVNTKQMKKTSTL